MRVCQILSSGKEVSTGERGSWGGGVREKDGETGHCCNMYSSNNVHVRFHCNSSKYLEKIIRFPLQRSSCVNLWYMCNSDITGNIS